MKNDSEKYISNHLTKLKEINNFMQNVDDSKIEENYKNVKNNPQN